MGGGLPPSSMEGASSPGPMASMAPGMAMALQGTINARTAPQTRELSDHDILYYVPWQVQ